MTELLTLTQASRRYGVTEKTMRRWVKAGNLGQWVAQGRKHWLIDTSRLDQFLEHTGISTGIVPISPSTGIDPDMVQGLTEEIASLKARMEALEQRLDEEGKKRKKNRDLDQPSLF